MTEELKPCPFCGSGNIGKFRKDGDERVGYRATLSLTCYECHASMSRTSAADKQGWSIEPTAELEKRLADAWNRRALIKQSASKEKQGK